MLEIMTSYESVFVFWGYVLMFALASCTIIWLMIILGGGDKDEQDNI